MTGRDQASSEQTHNSLQNPHLLKFMLVIPEVKELRSCTGASLYFYKSRHLGTVYVFMCLSSCDFHQMSN